MLRRCIDSRGHSGSTPGYGIGGSPLARKMRFAAATIRFGSDTRPSSRNFPRRVRRTRCSSRLIARCNGRDGHSSMSSESGSWPSFSGGFNDCWASAGEPSGYRSSGERRPDPLSLDTTRRVVSRSVQGYTCRGVPLRSITTRTHLGGAGSRKSASVTRPSVTWWIRLICSGDGIRSPLRYRKTVLRLLTPSIQRICLGLRSCSCIKSASFIDSV